MKIDDLKENAEVINGKKQINISINLNENTNDYKKYYYELERYMMANCTSLKEKIASNEKQSTKSFSENKKALEFYSQGLNESKKENYEKSVECFEKAVKEDPEFAFAWDNLGLDYRRLNNFDKAIESYKKSLEIDPNGLMPLQNIAIVYQYKKEYTKAIEAYEKLAEIDKNNPEVYYGIGNIYATYLNDYEKGLENLCKAYNLYIKQKSPYRADAEKLINLIYSEMKKQGKEEEFNKILKSNNISQN
jgi:tetratricopeptide (TPR) repeat protein